MHLYLDCRFGASGDMLLASLIEIGVDVKRLIADLRTLEIPDWEIETARVRRSGIASTQIKIIDRTETKLIEHHHHDHHKHHDHHHSGDHHHKEDAPADHEAPIARGLADFLTALARANFSSAVKARAEKVFRLLAEVEGAVHQTPPEKVHFHEISGIDSLLDVCGVCLAAEYLEVEKIIGSTVEVGGGFVNCAHGKMPVPAPATAEILRASAIPFTSGLADKELLTPTGAALLAVLVDEWADAMPSGKIHAIGYGAGSADFSDHANIARSTLLIPTANAVENGGWREEKIGEIRLTVDDLTGEQIGFFSEKMRKNGAFEVYSIPTTMKKNRPGNEIVILISPDQRDRFFRLIFRDGITLGLRYQEIFRAVLPREIKEKIVAGETVRQKIGTLAGEIVYQKIEYDDAARIAENRNEPLAQVQKKLAAELYNGPKI